MSSSTPSPRSEAAALVEKLSDDPRLSGRKPQLAALARALRDGTDADRWAAVDLHAAFMRNDTVEARKGLRGKAGPYVGLGIQVLVFVPILVTWLGLMLATGAYRQAQADPLLAHESFLQGWQTGFGGHLSDLFTLNHLALYTVVLICLIMLLTIMHFVIADELDERDRARLLRDLSDALTAADLELAAVRSAATGTASAELRKVASDMSKTATHVATIGETATRVQREALASLEVMSDALKKVEAATVAVTTAADTMGLQVGEVGAATGKMATVGVDLARGVNDAGARLGTSLDKISDQMRSALETSGRDLSAVVAESSTRIADALGEFQETGTIYTHRVEMAADILGQAGQTIKALPSAVDHLHERVTDLATCVSDLASQIAAASASADAATMAAAAGELLTSARALQSAAGSFNRRSLRAGAAAPVGTEPSVGLPDLDRTGALLGAVALDGSGVPPSRRGWQFWRRRRP